MLIQGWPAEQLEVVDNCPFCSSNHSEQLETDLIDWQSEPPTGFWKMKSCIDCGVAYLSPRPDADSIKNAYKCYYTHTSDKDDLVHACMRSFKNYLAERYYAVASQSCEFFDYAIYLVARVLFPVSMYFEAKSRHIFTVKNKPGKLLDVGCGNGEFLRFANKFGWSVVGVDFDKDAVFEARSSGLDVRQGDIHVIDNEEKFDFISLSHVIEHVYEPTELVRQCFSLLNVDGVLWLETPNVDSFGHTLYKSNWRGLEPPRHIMLFNIATINSMLKEAGFASVEQKQHSLSGAYMGLASERLIRKSLSCDSITCRLKRSTFKLFRILFLELAQLTCKRRREFITLVAIK